MMHGTEKSDPSVVPTKPANKAEHSAAESVEGRGGTKRNAELQSTVRTRSREAASQAQARIRRAAMGTRRRSGQRSCTTSASTYYGGPSSV